MLIIARRKTSKAFHQLGQFPVLYGKRKKFTETIRDKFCQAAKRRCEDVYGLLGDKPLSRYVTPVIIVTHQAVYAKAPEIMLFSIRDRFPWTVLHMEGFQTILSFVTVVSHRFGSAGLGDVLLEADALLHLDQ